MFQETDKHQFENPPGRPIERKTELFEYQVESTGKIYEAFVARDASKTEPVPLVLNILPASFGRTKNKDDKACLLADMGYIGFSVDIFEKGIRGASREESRKLVKEFMEDREGLFHFMKSTFEAARTLPYVDPNKVKFGKNFEKTGL